MVVVGVLCLLAARARGHGSMVEPVPRNAIDRSLPKDQRSPPHTCDCANATGDACDVAQSCYWYSQGCTIGCPSCDHTNGRAQIDLCGLGKASTLNDSRYRSVNVDATGELDIYRFNPWRAPGSAPVADACGLAGGTPWGADVAECEFRTRFFNPATTARRAQGAITSTPPSQSTATKALSFPRRPPRRGSAARRST